MLLMVDQSRLTDRFLYQPYREGMGSRLSFEALGQIRVAATPQELSDGLVKRTQALICANTFRTKECVLAWNHSRIGINISVITE